MVAGGGGDGSSSIDHKHLKKINSYSLLNSADVAAIGLPHGISISYVFQAETSTSTSTQKTNVLEYEYDYFTICSSTITLECNHDYFHDYFNECPVSSIKATFMESLGVILVLLCH